MVVLTQKDHLADSDINTSSDAPPAYEDLISSHHVTPLSTLTHGEEKRRSTGSLTAASEREDEGIGADRRRASTSNISPTQSKATIRSIGINKNWFSWFSEKDTRKEVKQTIQSLV